MERIVNKYRKKAEVIMRKVKLTKESTKDILETLLKRSLIIMANMRMQ